MFSAAIDGAATRPVYGSSVAAYGFHADNPELLTDDIPPRGARRHYYSAQTAELEEALAELLAGANTDGYVFRPCIVAGPDALAPVRSIPNLPLSERLPSVVMRALELMRALKPVIPDPGVPFQLLHHDDVARALDWYSFPVPISPSGPPPSWWGAAVRPAEAQWIESLRRPVLMDTTRAHEVLGWRPPRRRRDAPGDGGRGPV